MTQMQIQVCFANENGGAWMDFTPEKALPATDTPVDVASVTAGLRLPEGMTGVRITTATEVWTFCYHPTYGCVPRLEVEGDDVNLLYPTNEEVGGVWVVNHVLPDGNVLPLGYVEAGEDFEMGDDESPSRRRVNVPAGFMAITPTTVRQWNWYATAAGKPLKAVTVKDKAGNDVDLLDHPVTEVNFYESTEFAEWAGIGLPTEEQWERAARGNDGRKFPWGNESPTQETCHSSIQVQQERTDSVFNRPAGASPYGMLDMSGNVWEWTSTIHR